MDLSKYSKQIKFLTTIPLLVGILTFIEVILPNNSITTTVVSKKEKYRKKTDKTTYTIQFEYLDDQFTPEIYEALSKGDKVTLEVSPVHKQIKSVSTLNNKEKFQNETGENYYIFGFGLVFLLSSLVWLKKGVLSKNQSNYIALIILVSIISIIRMI